MGIRVVADKGSSEVKGDHRVCVCVCVWYSVAVWTISVHVCALVRACPRMTIRVRRPACVLESHIASRCHGKSFQVKDSRTCFIRLANPRQVQPPPRLSTMRWWLAGWAEKVNGHSYGKRETILNMGYQLLSVQHLHAWIVLQYCFMLNVW